MVEADTGDAELAVMLTTIPASAPEPRTGAAGQADNVLSFPAMQPPPDESQTERRGMLGDIAIAYESHAPRGRRRTKPFDHHLSLLPSRLSASGRYDHEKDGEAESDGNS